MPTINNIFLSLLTTGFFVLSKCEYFFGSTLLTESISHMSFHFLFLFIFLAILSGLGKYWVAFGLSTLASIIFCVQILPYYISSNSSLNGEKKTAIHLLMSNVNSRMGSPEKLVKLVQNHRPNILFLMEVSPRWKESLEQIEENYEFHKTDLRNDNFGLALFSNLPVKDLVMLNHGPSKIPSYKVQFLTKDESKLNIILTHPLPPINQLYYDLRNRHLNEVAIELERMPPPKMLFGDLNITSWTRRFEKFKSKLNLRDCRKGFGIRPTWPAQTYPVQIAIDQCLHSKGLDILNIKTLENIDSDHLPVLTRFTIGD